MLGLADARGAAVRSVTGVELRVPDIARGSSGSGARLGNPAGSAGARMLKQDGGFRSIPAVKIFVQCRSAQVRIAAPFVSLEPDPVIATVSAGSHNRLSAFHGKFFCISTNGY
jgi:hypothetical protein